MTERQTIIVMPGGGDKASQQADISAAMVFSKTIWKIMNIIKKINVMELPEFDIADYLTDEKAVAEYLTVVLEENDSAAFVHALGTIAIARARARGIIKASGMGREALYKALRVDT